jgi:hypothetical protein
MPQNVATLDAKLRQAVPFHQARRLAEAESIHRQILALRPDLADVRLNCALAQMGQGKYPDAEQSLRQRCRPGPAWASPMPNWAMFSACSTNMPKRQKPIAMLSGLIPDHAEAHNNLGNV